MRGVEEEEKKRRGRTNGEEMRDTSVGEWTVYSQDLQIAQCPKCSIFNAADVVAVQLPAEHTQSRTHAHTQTRTRARHGHTGVEEEERRQSASGLWEGLVKD